MRKIFQNGAEIFTQHAKCNESWEKTSTLSNNPLRSPQVKPTENWMSTTLEQVTSPSYYNTLGIGTDWPEQTVWTQNR